MAHFHPSLLPRCALTAGDHAELAVLRLLEEGLSDAYTLFHSVDWTDALGTDARHGEVDIIIVELAISPSDGGNPAGTARRSGAARGGCHGPAHIGRWPRFHEIEAWLDRHDPLADWRALDDAVLEFPKPCRQLIACHPQEGFGPRQAQALARWLVQRGSGFYCGISHQVVAKFE